MKKVFWVFGFVLSLGYGHAQAISMKECQQVSAEMNKGMPMQVNQVTVISTTFCESGRKKPILTYKTMLEADKELLTTFVQSGIVKEKRHQIRGWCTDPQQLITIKAVDIRVVYYDMLGKYLGEIDHKFEDCSLLD